MKLLSIIIFSILTNSSEDIEEYPCPPDTDVCEDEDENGFCDEAEKEDPPNGEDETDRETKV